MTVQDPSSEEEKRVGALHHEAFVFDASIPPTGFFRDEEGEIRSLLDGGVTGVNSAVGLPGYGFQRAAESITQHKKLAERHSERIRICTSTTELEEGKRRSQVGLVIHFQDSKPIEDNLDHLSTFYDLGLRVFQLTYNSQGYVGSGCCERHDPGLSTFGLDVVAECNRLGILIDLSHCGHTTSWDAIRHSRKPVSFTHVGIYALCPAYGRNKPDDLLRAVADTGGVVGITLFPPFVKRNPSTHEVLQASLDDVLDQIDYAVRLLGPDHVGFGSDLSNYTARTLEVAEHSSYRTHRAVRPDVFGAGHTDRKDPFPIGLDSHSKMLNLTRGLTRRGYGDEDVKKMLGGNWLRLYKEVWQL